MKDFISRIKNGFDCYLQNVLKTIDFGGIKKFEKSLSDEELQCIQHSLKTIELHLQNGIKPNFSEKIKLTNGTEVVVGDILFNMTNEKQEMFKQIYNYTVDDFLKIIKKFMNSITYNDY